MNGLAQRQEHGEQKGGEELTWEDGRRVVLYTAMVMAECDRMLSWEAHGAIGLRLTWGVDTHPNRAATPSPTCTAQLPLRPLKLRFVHAIQAFPNRVEESLD